MKHFVIIVIVFMLLLSGCATIGQDLFVKEGYKKEIVKSSKITLSNVFARAEDGGLIVKGHIRKRHPGVGIAPKFVRVDLINANGELFDSKKVTYVPRNFSSRKRFQIARFKAEFPTMPGTGSTIQIAGAK